MEGTQRIIDECWKIVNQNSEEQEEGYKIAGGYKIFKIRFGNLYFDLTPNTE